MENDKKLVVKHNKLVEFKGKMTTNELKLFSLIIADVRDQQEKTLQEYSIDISILRETTKHKDFYKYIKDIALKLEEKRIIVESISDKGKRECYPIRLIYRPKIVEDSKHLEVYIDKDLIPYIIDLKREFTRYQIENILRLRSSYAVRVYELLKQYEIIERREISIEDLREYLGIEQREYERFTNFEARVLQVAKEEINENTDINIDYKKIKKGRTISKLLFTIKPKNLAKKQYIQYLDENYDIDKIKRMSGLENEKFNSKQIMDLYEIAVNKTESENVNPFEYIRLNYVIMMQGNTVRNKYAYLKKALENDYAIAVGQLKINLGS